MFLKNSPGITNIIEQERKHELFFLMGQDS